ncbi:Ig-like domain-containing protein, partial [Pareuzebyella sediminis]
MTIFLKTFLKVNLIIFLFFSVCAEAQTSVTGVAVSPATVTVTEGLAQQLTAAITPLDADDATVLWSSDDEAVAT